MLKSAEEKIRAHTKKEKAEVCGLICEAPQGDKFGVRFFTAKSHIACPVFSLCPEGLVPRKDMTDIHTHVDASNSSVSWVDWWFSGQRIGQSLARVNISQFSPADKAGPPGYLVTPRAIRYWQGTGEIEESGPGLTERPVGLLCRGE